VPEDDPTKSSKDHKSTKMPGSGTSIIFRRDLENHEENERLRLGSRSRRGEGPLP